MIKKIVSVLLCILNMQLTQAQSSTSSGWLASFNTISIKGKWSMHADLQFRSTQGYAAWQTILLRPGINYQAGKRTVITAGYAFIANRTTLQGQTNLLQENRLWQQFIYNQPLAKNIVLTHRFRFEERWIPTAAINNGEVVSSGNIFATRLRYFVRTVLPLSKPNNGFAKGWFAALQNEIFVHTSNQGKLNNKAFDQNRLYLASGYRISKKLDLEAGYLWQYVDRRSPATNQHNHVAQLAVYTRL